MHTNNIVRLAWCAVLSLACALGCASAQAADKISVGAIPIVDVAPIYLGKEKGFFAKQNLDLTIETAQGGAELITPIIVGQRQFGFSNLTSIIIAQTRGLDLVAVAPGVSSTGERGRDFGGVVSAPGSTLRDAKDLEGKTVAVNNLKNISDTLVKASIRRAGGDDSKVKFVEMPFPDMPAALAAKKIDAAWVVEPFLTLAKDQGGKVVAWNLVDVSPNLMIAVYFTSRKYARDNPDLVARFKTAITESLAYADSHPDEVRAIVPTYTKITKEIVGKLTLPRWPTAFDRKSAEAIGELVQKDGLTAKAPDLNALFP